MSKSSGEETGLRIIRCLPTLISRCRMESMKEFGFRKHIRNSAVSIFAGRDGSGREVKQQ